MADAIKTVLVTGASGKLGVPLCAALLARDYQVLALRHRNSTGLEGIHEIQGSVADARLMHDLVNQSDAVIHLATCKEDRDGLFAVSLPGTFNLLEAAMRGGKPKRLILASGDAANGIYYNPQPVPISEDLPLKAYPGYYGLSKVLEEELFRQYHYQAGVPTICLRISWIHAEDDILNHLTVAGEPFGVPAWRELMNDDQRALYQGSRDAAVALRRSDGRPLRRQIVAVEDVVQTFLLALERDHVIGETFLIAMTDPFDYVSTSEYVAERLGIEVLPLVDPAGQDFFIDTSKARYVLGFQPRFDIYQLIDRAVDFRRSRRQRQQRSGYKG